MTVQVFRDQTVDGLFDMIRSAPSGAPSISGHFLLIRQAYTIIWMYDSHDCVWGTSSRSMKSNSLEQVSADALTDRQIRVLTEISKGHRHWAALTDSFGASSASFKTGPTHATGLLQYPRHILCAYSDFFYRFHRRLLSDTYELDSLCLPGCHNSRNASTPRSGVSYAWPRSQFASFTL